VTERTAGTRFERLRTSDLRTPMRAQAGLRYLDHGCGRLDEAMGVPVWLRDGDGSVSPAALLILADSTLAAAVATTLAADRVPVTRRFSLELVGHAPVRATELVASARVVHTDDRQATVRGDVRAGGTLIAVASMRTAIVPDRSGPDARPSAAADRPDQPPSLATAWPLEPVAGRSDEVSVVLWTPAPPWQANSIGTLHGGAVAAIGERAVAAVLATPAVRPVLGDVVVDYLRPLPADGSAVEVRITVAHRSERVAVAHARLSAADGAPAALVRAAVDLVGQEGVRRCSTG
jgi:acyl-coenzyme A thioesterase PaaI-like protein